MPKLNHKNYARLSTNILLVFIGGMLLGGCGDAANSTSSSQASPPTLADVGGWESRWLNSLPCSPPCWEGIIPGKTTVREAQNLLKSNSFVTSVKIRNGISGSIYWESNNVGFGLGDALFDSSEQIIKAIRPGFRPNKLTLGDVISHFGEPGHVSVGTTWGGNSVFYSTIFYYLDKGFSIYYSLADSKPGVYDKNIVINWVTFFGPDIKALELDGVKNPTLIPWQSSKGFDYYCKIATCFDYGELNKK